MKKRVAIERPRKGGLSAWQQVRREVVIALILMIVIKVIMIIQYGLLATLNLAGGYDWLVVVAMATYMGWQAAKRRKITYKAAGYLGTVAGAYAGIGVAVLDLMLYRNGWALANIVLRPLLFLAISGAVTMIVFTLRFRNGASFK